MIPALRERRYGDAEGTLVADFGATFGPWHQAEIPGAETTDEVVVRALAALRALAADADGAHVVAVSHGAVMSALLRHFDILPEGTRVTNGAAHSFVVDGDDVRPHEARASVS